MCFTVSGISILGIRSLTSPVAINQARVVDTSVWGFMVYYLGCIYNADTFSIITTNANPLMERIHNTKKRMPLILSREDIQRWVNPTTQTQDVDRLMQSFDASHMDAYEISKETSNARINRNHAGIKERVDNINLFKQ